MAQFELIKHKFLNWNTLLTVCQKRFYFKQFSLLNSVRLSNQMIDEVIHNVTANQLI